MDTPIKDTRLEYELQDLYMASKHWLSDIGFFSDEVRFFNDIIDKYFKPDIIGEQGAQLHHCKIMLYQQQFVIISLKHKIADYLDFIGPIITNTQKKVGLDLIERHTVLKNEIAALFESITILKKDLFALAEDVMNNDKNLFI